jgi:WD40 repeat protein
VASDRLKLFISYSRRDIVAAEALVAALEAENFEITIDRRDLPYGEEWQEELGDFIRGSDTVVWLVSPDSVTSKWCKWELGVVERFNKRLVPVRIRDIAPEDLPESLGRIHLLPVDGIYEPASHFSSLVMALNTDRSWVKEANRLSDRAREWNARGRSSGLLLRGAGLKNAEAWSTVHPKAAPPPASEVLELILASRRAAVRRQRWTIGGSLGFALVASILAALAFWQSRESRSRELAALAGNQLALDPAVSLQLAHDAVKVSSTQQAGEALRRALFASHVRLVIPSRTTAPSDPTNSPDVVAALNRKNDAVAISRGDGMIELWSVAEGRQLASFSVNLEPAFIAFEDEDHAVAVTARDGARQIWRLDQVERNEPVVGSATSSLATGQRGKVIAPGTMVGLADDHSVIVTSLATGQQRHLPRIRPNKDGVKNNNAKILAISPDGKWMVAKDDHSFSFDAVIIDVLTGDVKRRLEGHEDPVSKALFSPDSQIVATITHWVHTESGGGVTAYGDKTVRLWDVSSEERPRELRGHTREILDVAFSPNGNLLVTSSIDETARLWDRWTARELAALRGHNSAVQSATFSVDGTRILTTAEDGGVRLWEAVAGKEVRVKIGEQADIDAAFSSDSRRVLTFDDYHGKASVCDSRSGDCLLTVGGDGDKILSASFSPDGERLLTIGPQEFREREIPTGNIVRRMSIADTNDRNEWRRATMSPGAWTLAVTAGRVETVSGGGTWLVREFGSRNETQNLSESESPSYRANFNHDGTLLVVAGEDTEAQVYVVATGALLHKLSGSGGHKDRLLQAVFGPQNTPLTTSRDASAILWDSEGKITRRFRGHDDAVTEAAFSPDGSLIATVSADSTVRVWDVSTGETLTVLGGLGDVKGTVFSADGRTLLTVSSDAIVRIYPLPAYGSIPDMMEIAARNLNLLQGVPQAEVEPAPIAPIL